MADGDGSAVWSLLHCDTPGRRPGWRHAAYDFGFRGPGTEGRLPETVKVQKSLRLLSRVERGPVRPVLCAPTIYEPSEKAAIRALSALYGKV